MTPAESLVIVRLVRAACPAQKFDEYTPDVWHKMLLDLNYRECETAVIEIGKRQVFMAPADIRAEVKKTRAANSVRDQTAIPDADPDDVCGYLAALREGRYRAEEEPTKKRDVLALIAKASRGKGIDA